MININIQILLASLLVSTISLVGVITFGNGLSRLAKYFISIAIGTILGDVFFHILPEVLEDQEIDLKRIFAFLLLGILTMFLLESKFRHIHCHQGLEDPEHDHNYSNNKILGKMNLISNSLHNFVDGILIATTFLIDPTVGFATTIAIIAHEIPTEISNFMILIHSGYSKNKALLYNAITAVFGLLGSLIVILTQDQLASYLPSISSFTAGFLLYIAMSDLIPEVHSHKSKKSRFDSYLHIFLIIIGIALMYFLTTLE